MHTDESMRSPEVVIEPATVLLTSNTNQIGGWSGIKTAGLKR
jgi:hypothetical protein